LGPMSPQSSPSCTAKSTALTAVRPPKRMVTWSSWRREAGMAGTDRESRGRTRRRFLFLRRTQAEIEEALRSGEHEDDEQERVDDHPVFGDRAQDLGEEREEDRGEDDPEGVAHAAENDHDDDFDALG